jgi:hypothetical protein
MTIPATLSPDVPVLAPNGAPLTIADDDALRDGWRKVGCVWGHFGEFLFRLVARGKLAKAWKDLRTRGRRGRSSILRPDLLCEICIACRGS